MNYDDMSDDELSSKLMTVIHGEQIDHWCLSNCETYVYDCGPIGEQFHKVDIIDINNPAHMWPIILNNKISVMWDWAEMGKCSAIGKAWESRQLGKCFMNHEFTDTSPLRAAAIVFLKMQNAS